MRGITDAQTVIGQGAIFVGVRCHIDVAVVEIVVRAVPISAYQKRLD